MPLLSLCLSSGSSPMTVSPSSRASSTPNPSPSLALNSSHACELSNPRVWPFPCLRFQHPHLQSLPIFIHGMALRESLLSNLSSSLGPSIKCIQLTASSKSSFPLPSWCCLLHFFASPVSPWSVDPCFPYTTLKSSLCDAIRYIIKKIISQNSIAPFNN